MASQQGLRSLLLRSGLMGSVPRSVPGAALSQSQSVSVSFINERLTASDSQASACKRCRCTAGCQCAGSSQDSTRRNTNITASTSGASSGSSASWTLLGGHMLSPAMAAALQGQTASNSFGSGLRSSRGTQVELAWAGQSVPQAPRGMEVPARSTGFRAVFSSWPSQSPNAPGAQLHAGPSPATPPQEQPQPEPSHWQLPGAGKATDQLTPPLQQDDSTDGSINTPMLTRSRGNEYQPSRRKRVNKHGLERRLKEAMQRRTLLNRIKKGRWRLTADQFVI